MRETMLIHAMDSMPIEHIVHVRCCHILCSLSVMPARPDTKKRPSCKGKQEGHFDENFLLMDVPASLPGDAGLLTTAPENGAECGSDAASNMRPAAR
jgi:hypothetical protein